MNRLLRRLTEDEMDQVATIHRVALDDRLPWLAGIHTPTEDQAFFRHHVFTRCEVWGAIDEVIVGFIAFRQGWIDQLHVLPGRQRRGHGQALLRRAQSVSACLQLWTFQRNGPALRFYETHGFVAVERTDGSGNEEREPDVRYRWDAKR